MYIRKLQLTKTEDAHCKGVGKALIGIQQAFISSPEVGIIPPIPDKTWRL